MIKQSANPASYLTPPPNIPYFMFKRYSNAYEKMIAWAEKEFQDRLIYCADHGYWKTLKYLNEEYSPLRILAEVHGFRHMCSMLNQAVWNKLSGRHRVFIRKSYELRDILFR
jgi:hypothetical protein